MLRLVCLLACESGKDDSGAREKAGGVQRLEDQVMASFVEIGVENEFGIGPEFHTRRKASKDLYVSCHVKVCDRLLLSAREWRGNVTSSCCRMPSEKVHTALLALIVIPVEVRAATLVFE